MKSLAETMMLHTEHKRRSTSTGYSERAHHALGSSNSAAEKCQDDHQCANCRPDRPAPWQNSAKHVDHEQSAKASVAGPSVPKCRPGTSRNTASRNESSRQHGDNAQYSACGLVAKAAFHGTRRTSAAARAPAAISSNSGAMSAKEGTKSSVQPSPALAGWSLA